MELPSWKKGHTIPLTAAKTTTAANPCRRPAASPAEPKVNLDQRSPQLPNHFPRSPIAPLPHPTAAETARHAPCTGSPEGPRPSPPNRNPGAGAPSPPSNPTNQNQAHAHAHGAAVRRPRASAPETRRPSPTARARPRRAPPLPPSPFARERQ
jgi:hypothetical protein